MSFSSWNFLSLDNPPVFECDPLPTSFSPSDEFECMYAFPLNPQRMRGPVLSPTELEEANAFVDAMLTDGDDTSEPANGETMTNQKREMEANTEDTELGETKKRRKKNGTATLEDMEEGKPARISSPFPLTEKGERDDIASFKSKE